MTTPTVPGARRYFSGGAELEQTSLVREYRCVAMDPPWPLTGAGKSKRGADRHYDVVKIADMPSVIRGSGVFFPATDAHLWMWVVDNFAHDAMHLMEALGFRPIKPFLWHKERRGNSSGMGFYGTNDTEMLWLAVRGSLPPLPTAKKTRNWFSAPVGEHSVKPAAAYTNVIERITPGPRLEMFARQPRPGWDVWGNDPNVASKGGDP